MEVSNETNSNGMKTLLLTLTYLVGAGELVLAWYFWKTNSGNEIRKVMALLAFSLGMWVITSAFVAYKPDDNLFLILTSRLIFVFGSLLLTSLFHFTLIYPYPVRIFDQYHKILLYIPAVIFSLIAVTSNAIYQGAYASETVAGQVIPGPVYNHYNVYLLLLYVLSIVIMVRRLPTLSGDHQKITRLMITAVIIGGLPAVVIDLVMPLVVPNIVPNSLYGNLFTGVWLGATSYVVMRRV